MKRVSGLNVCKCWSGEKLLLSFVNSSCVKVHVDDHFYLDDLYHGDFHRAIKMHTNWLEYFSDKAKNVKVENLGKKVKDHYIKVMIAMRDRIATSLTNYDLHSMGLGISLLWMVSTILYLFTFVTYLWILKENTKRRNMHFY